MLHWAAYGPLNVASTKGLFAAEGVDVEVVNRVSNQELNAELTSGRIDIALDMMGSWVGIHLGGTPLKIVWFVLDVMSIVLLGSGLYLWLVKRKTSAG